MSLAPSKSPADPNSGVAQVFTFCKVCFWIVGGLVGIWLGALLFAAFS